MNPAICQSWLNCNGESTLLHTTWASARRGRFVETVPFFPYYVSYIRNWHYHSGQQATNLQPSYNFVTFDMVTNPSLPFPEIIP